MRRIFLVFAFFLFATFTIAQEHPDKHHGTIKGKVFSSDGQPASFVPIGVKGSHKGTSTDENGNFHFQLSAGKHVLLIQFIGHEAEEEEIEVKAGETTEVPDFKLRESTKELQEVEIMGKTEAQEVKESGFAVNAIETKQFANTTSDLNQILNRSTGIKVREEGGMGSTFNFAINGLSGKRVRYFLDGVPMEVFGSGMSLNNIPVNLAERVEVYKGVVPVHLGSDAMGGAVNVITNQKIKNYLDVSHSYGSFNSHRSALTGQFTHDSTGITVRANAFYNYSDNNYTMYNNPDYDIKIEVIENNKFVKKDGLRRFHDSYRSAMGQVEAGVMGKKWADVFFVGGSYSNMLQDRQTGFKQEIVYGLVTQKTESYNVTLRYRKDNLFVKGLGINLFASRSQDHVVIADTGKYRYYWDGSRVTNTNYELQGERQLSQIIRPRAFARANLNYDLHRNHSFNLNYTLDQVDNQMFNKLLQDKDELPAFMRKTILGMAYQALFFQKRLTTQLFGKHYGMGMRLPVWSTNSREYELKDTTVGNFGYGAAARLRILVDFGLKASYEHAYRLQEVEEMFGNGLNMVGNPDLKPETSDNFNIGAYGSKKFGKHSYYLEAGSFYRRAKDFIATLAYERSNAVKAENQEGIEISGLEAEAKYSYHDLLMFSVNGTYQNAINMVKYTKRSGSQAEATYGNKLPNQPWLFGNTDLSMGKSNVFKKNTRLQFNWNSQYTHWYYLTWEAYGSKNGKSIIPAQYIHNASITYSLQDGRYNITLECRNFTNELAYDNFRLQKPGRAFFVKLRYFLK